MATYLCSCLLRRYSWSCRDESIIKYNLRNNPKILISDKLNHPNQTKASFTIQFQRMEGVHYPQVTVLFDGYSEDKEEYTLANCSCTLIKGTPNVIVDTMTPWDGNRLEEALTKHGIKNEDIQYVINTHGHSDHTGCNYLFPKATHIVGFCISHQNKYFNHDFKAGDEYVINEKIKIIPTPGHTLQDISVIVTTTQGVIAITGDLFEKEEDLTDDTIWKSAGSDSEELQQNNRIKILQMADYVIPGHGPMFKVNKNTLN